MKDSLYSYPTYFNDMKFVFLNKAYQFYGKIDWNYAGHGMLWAYNLNYFEFLHQYGFDKETGLKLINDFIDHYKEVRIGYDSYPISLRNIFWIRFITRHAIQDERIDAFLYGAYKILFGNLEYHVLGNHLLENAFSLLFGAFYFQDSAFYHKAYTLLHSELQEQLLPDGAHFELSPMYHQIMLYRLLDTINLAQHNKRFDKQECLLAFMQDKAKRMLSWLNAITFANGAIPLLNDAVPGIAPTTEQLDQYALDLKIIAQGDIDRYNPARLSESGYRCFKNDVYECMLDIGRIGPSYQPGHAHADTFNFVLNAYHKPLIIDTGISTYDSGKVRSHERGTAAHNTVTVLDRDSSEVWSSFRAARRAHVRIIEDTAQSVIAEHDGYKRIGTIHKRQWTFSDRKIVITDFLAGKVLEGKAYLHIAPSYTPEKRDLSVKIGSVVISFENTNNITITQTQIPDGYNLFQNNYTIEIIFEKYLTTLLDFL
jgi:hypothetical protein